MREVTTSTERMKFKGTIIDFETTGDFDNRFSRGDPRSYGDIKPTIFGYLFEDVVVQFCAESIDEITDLLDIISEYLPDLDEPYLALNTAFERHILKKYCDMTPVFTDVRGLGVIASKKWLRDELGLPDYNDPFDCNGNECRIQWDLGNYDPCIIHNQACLQLERDIYEIRKLEPSKYPF